MMTKNKRILGTMNITRVKVFLCGSWGLERCWQQHVPEGLDADTPVPLLVDMHGYSSDSTNHKKLSSFDKIADDHGAIVVYPDGVLGRNLPLTYRKIRHGTLDGVVHTLRKTTLTMWASSRGW